MTQTDRHVALEPVIGAGSRVLILGSLPGRISLSEQRYYAHPQNQFWRLVGGVIDTDLVGLPYEDRLAALLDASIGLWDVIDSASRIGSLDSAIRDAQPRDLAAFVSHHPNLRAIAFNGGTAYRIGVRQLGLTPTAPLLALPSSSAAHTIAIATKQMQWNAIRHYLVA